MKYFDIDTVLDLSLRATQNFEWTSRVRSDHGGEKVGCGMQWKKEERLIEGAFLWEHQKWKVNSYEKTYAASRNLFVDRLYLRATEAFFFQLTKFFKLSCSCTDAAKRNTMYCCQGSFLFFKAESFIWLFVEESVAKGLIDGCVFDNLMQTFTADHRKNLSKFQFFN